MMVNLCWARCSGWVELTVNPILFEQVHMRVKTMEHEGKLCKKHGSREPLYYHVKPGLSMKINNT